jgi:hypothetical protein
MGKVSVCKVSPAFAAPANESRYRLRMSDFALAWELSRSRFVDEVSSLSAAQLRWRLHPAGLSIGQMALHVAGVEVSFGSQLKGSTLDEFEGTLKRCATEGVVNDLPFPVGDDAIEPDLVQRALAAAEAIWRPLIEAAAADIRQGEIKSALGPMISGEGAFARLSFHSAYHQGQAYLMKTTPGFPAA